MEQQEYPEVPLGLCTARDKATYRSIKGLLEPSCVARRGGLALQKWRAIPYGGYRRCRTLM